MRCPSKSSLFSSSSLPSSTVIWSLESWLPRPHSLNFRGTMKVTERMDLIPPTSTSTVLTTPAASGWLLLILPIGHSYLFRSACLTLSVPQDVCSSFWQKALQDVYNAMTKKSKFQIFARHFSQYFTFYLLFDLFPWF